jgi:hypothetical protein
MKAKDKVLITRDAVDSRNVGRKAVILEVFTTTLLAKIQYLDNHKETEITYVMLEDIRGCK